jgi:uncharacterized protein
MSAMSCEVLGIRNEGTSGAHVVLIREKDGCRCLSIDVGPVEALAVIRAQNGVRPDYSVADDRDYVLPHLLISDALTAVGVQLLGVAITGPGRGDLRAELTLSNGRVVSASPADSISLSLVTGAPVVAAETLIVRAGVTIPRGDGNDEPTDPAGPREQPSAPLPPLPEMRRAEVEGVYMNTQTSKPVALLKEKQGGRQLIIGISPSEGAAILSLKEPSPGLPSTHDLFGEVLKAAGTRLLAVRVIKPGEQAHLGDLQFSEGVRIRARAGDSLAFALRAGAEIFVASQLLEDAGV